MKRLDNYVKMIGGVATAEYTAVAVAYANLIDQIGVAFGRAAAAVVGENIDAALARADAAATAIAAAPIGAINNDYAVAIKLLAVNAFEVIRAAQAAAAAAPAAPAAPSTTE